MEKKDDLRSGRGPISIILPAFNSTRTLRHTLPSLLEQNRKLIAEIIVVDSSDDGLMPDLLREFEPQGITFITSGIRVMPAVQRNIGARASTGTLLLFLDSDVILEKDYVEKIYAFHLQGHRAGFGSVTIPEFQKSKPVVVAQYYFQLSEYLPGGRPQTKSFVLGCSTFVEREIFNSVGGYPEIRAAEDVLFGQKIEKIAPIWFYPDASVAHIFREDYKGYLRNQSLLGKFVAYYKKQERGSLSFYGFLPILLYPAFAFFKAMRIFSRILKAGIGHSIRCFLVLPAFTVGLAAWTGGFVKEALKKE